MEIRKEKFLQFSEKHRQHFLLKFASEIEAQWESAEIRRQKLATLKEILMWIDTSWVREKERVKPNMSLEALTQWIVPLERTCGLERTGEILVTSRDRSQAERVSHPLFFILENIRSSYNVGAFLRTADCLGIEKVYFSGYTATPEYERVQKTALGSAEAIPWEQETSTRVIIDELQNKGIPVIAMETAPNSPSIYQYQFPQPCALVFGNERDGVAQETLAKVSEIVHIPTYGVKNSLNVSISAGVVGFEVLRQWKY